MRNSWIKPAVRLMFAVTSRERATRQAARHLVGYRKLADGLSPEAGSRPVRVPPMPGVDEDMRNWSFYMTLEHNRIVSDSISATVFQLAMDEPLSGAALVDPKKGVMPSLSAGEEQIRQFLDSVERHVKLVETLGRLRGTRTARHPLFGDFDAHKWNCMFSFHLKIHYRQAAHVAQAARAGLGRS